MSEISTSVDPQYVQELIDHVTRRTKDLAWVHQFGFILNQYPGAKTYKSDWLQRLLDEVKEQTDVTLNKPYAYKAMQLALVVWERQLASYERRGITFEHVNIISRLSDDLKVQRRHLRLAAKKHWSSRELRRRLTTSLRRSPDPKQSHARPAKGQTPLDALSELLRLSRRIVAQADVLRWATKHLAGKGSGNGRPDSTSAGQLVRALKAALPQLANLSSELATMLDESSPHSR